ncbi:MAG: hypothetical protein ACI9MC_003814 [Kiritimatiellia bacterium]|jgi:hypothetical protein
MPSRKRRSGSDPSHDSSESGSASGKTTVETAVSNSDLIDMLQKGVDKEGQSRFDDALRNAQDIEDSGVLSEFAKLDDSEVPESESERTVEDDAILVMKGFSKLSPEQIMESKNKAYDKVDEEGSVDDALDVEYYGSADHKAWGALVEKLSGGVLSAEEAMSMNPSGGMIGPGVTMLRHLKGIDSLKRHAMRHDATGFLKTYFSVGPGYSSKTSIVGMQSSNPLSGQLTGWTRELFGKSSELDSGSEAATPSRYNKKQV